MCRNFFLGLILILVGAGIMLFGVHIEVPGATIIGGCIGSAGAALGFVDPETTKDMTSFRLAAFMIFIPLAIVGLAMVGFWLVSR